MTVQLIGRELDDIVRELYVLPSWISSVLGTSWCGRLERRVAGTGRAAAATPPPHPQRLAGELLASDSARCNVCRRWVESFAMPRPGWLVQSCATWPSSAGTCSGTCWIAPAHAAEAGVRVTSTVLLEVEATLQAALVDLAGALTIRNGRLVRPLSHSGFGRRPRVNIREMEAAADLRHADGTGETAELERLQVEDELAARRRAVADRWAVELVDVTDRALVEDDSGPPPDSGRKVPSQLRLAEEELAAAEASHWQSEFDLADAEGAVEAADDRLSSLDTKRIERSPTRSPLSGISPRRSRGNETP